MYYFQNLSFLIILSQSLIVFGSTDNYAVLYWKIENEGFHKEIKYNLQMINYSWKDCDVLLKQVVPRSLYINKDQLEDLKRLKKVNALVKDFVDTEMAEDVSPIHSVFLKIDLKEGDDNSFISEISLPVHIRYHSPQSGGGFRSAFINSPEIFVACSQYPSNWSTGASSMLPCSFDSTKFCEYYQVSYIREKESLEILIPVGNTDHFDIVVFVTYFITIGGTIYIYAVVLLSLPKST